MKVRIETPYPHLEYLRDEFGPCSKGVCEYLVCDPYNKLQLDAYPKLKMIATPSTGTNHIDLKECERRGIVVKSLLDDKDALNSISASSEFAFYLILSALRLGGFRMWKQYKRTPHMMGSELQGKRVGLIGYGRIGRNLARYLQAFGAEWDYYDPKYKTDSGIGDLFKTCDIVVICATLDDSTRAMITHEHLNLLKPRGILVNIARAEIIDENDLVTWAQKGENIYAADVLHAEVTDEHRQSPLLGLANCIIHPHIAGLTVESTSKAVKAALRMLVNAYAQ